MAAVGLCRSEHQSCKLRRIGIILHERAAADLDIEQDMIRAGRELFAHDARADQRDAVNGLGDIAQRIELLVGGREIAGLHRDGKADLPHLLQKPVGRECR